MQRQIAELAGQLAEERNRGANFDRVTQALDRWTTNVCRKAKTWIPSPFVPKRHCRFSRWCLGFSALLLLRLLFSSPKFCRHVGALCESIPQLTFWRNLGCLEDMSVLSEVMGRFLLVVDWAAFIQRVRNLGLFSTFLSEAGLQRILEFPPRRPWRRILQLLTAGILLGMVGSRRPRVSIDGATGFPRMQHALVPFLVCILECAPGSVYGVLFQAPLFLCVVLRWCLCRLLHRVRLRFLSHDVALTVRRSRLFVNILSQSFAFLLLSKMSTTSSAHNREGDAERV